MDQNGKFSFFLVIIFITSIGGSGPWKSTFTKDSTTFFKQLTAGSFLYQHVEN